MGVLEFPFHNAVRANVVLDTVDVRLRSNPLDLAKFGLIFANLGRIRLTCMALLPSIAACSAETGGFLARVGRVKILRELLLERDEEACSCTVGDGLTLALDAISTLLSTF